MAGELVPSKLPSALAGALPSREIVNFIGIDIINNLAYSSPGKRAGKVYEN